MIAEFCPYCGAKLTKKEIGDEGLVPYCENCQKPIFPMPCPCAIILCINKDNEVVLIKQSYGCNGYVLVAGYLQIGETFEECVKREVKEELNLNATNISYIGSYFQKSKENIMTAYACNVNGDIVLSGEVSEASFVKLEDAPSLLKDASIAQNVVMDFLKKVND